MSTNSNPEISRPSFNDLTSLVAVLRRFPRPVWMIFLGMFINRFGTFVLPFLALHMTKEGYSTVEISVSMGTYGVGHLVATLLGGYLADSIGRRNTIVLSMFSGALSMLALSQADSYLWFVVLGGFAGLTTELYRPASSALLSDLVPESDRVTAFAFYRFAINAGWAFGPATAGLLSEYSYLWLFVGDAMTAALYGVIALFGIPSLRRATNAPLIVPENPFTALGRSFRMALSDIRFVRVLVASVLIGVVFMQMMTTLGLEVKAHGHVERIYGLILGFNGVIIVLFEIPLSSLTQRYSPLLVMALGNLLIGIGAGMVAYAETVFGYCSAMAVFTAGEMIGMPVALAYVSKLAPSEMRGRYMGIYGLTWASSIVMGPSLGMMAFSIDPVMFWIGSGALGVLSAVVLITPSWAFQRIVMASPGFAAGANKY